ncbi:MAG: dynamin family protein, partial [Kutzneria sp.]|nr:dynamin family protein [Kutzneria sp.]
MPPSAAIDVVDIALKATTAYDRPDLGIRLQQARSRLVADGVRVLVVGEFKQGKSQLINAVVNAPVCPVDDDIATTVPTIVRHAQEPGVTLVRESDDGEGHAERRQASIDRIADHVSDWGNPSNRQRLSYVEVGIPRSILATGLTLVDTPGVGGLGSMHGAATMAVLPTADAVLFVSDAAGEYTATELEFLEQAMRVCPTVVCVLTKSDLYPEWRRIAELDRRHLAAAGVEAELVPVSSTLRLHAVRTDDHTLNGESGFPKLLDLLRGRILARSEQLARHAAAHDVLAVTEQLSTTMGAELAALQDPARAQAVVAELARAQQRVDQLRQQSAR